MFGDTVITMNRKPSPSATAQGALELPTCDDRLIWDVWLSRWQLPALTVADELGLFAQLEHGPATRNELTARLELGPRGAEVLLGILASLGFVVQRRERFALTDVARNFLLPGSAFYWGPMLHRTRQSEWHVTVREALRRDYVDASRVDLADRTDTRYIRAWAGGEIDTDQARILTAGMHSHSFPAAMGVARRGDFSGVRRLLDVAGGSGCFCIALALRYPEIRFTIMDLAPVCELAARYVAKYDASVQIDTHAANMFTDPWPQGYDAHFFSNIFHDWGDERRRFLAQRSFETLPSGGRIYLHEMLLADTADGPLPAALFSMSMLTGNEGKQFTAAELETQLTGVGFAGVTVTPTYGYYSLVAARKP